MSEVKYKSAVAAGIIAGSAAGIVTGLLIAPKSGKEIRDDIADKTKEGLDATKDKLGDMKDAAKDMLPTGSKESALKASIKAAHEALDKIG